MMDNGVINTAAPTIETLRILTDTASRKMGAANYYTVDLSRRKRAAG